MFKVFKSSWTSGLKSFLIILSQIYSNKKYFSFIKLFLSRINSFALVFGEPNFKRIWHPFFSFFKQKAIWSFFFILLVKAGIWRTTFGIFFLKSLRIRNENWSYSAKTTFGYQQAKWEIYFPLTLVKFGFSSKIISFIFDKWWINFLSDSDLDFGRNLSSQIIKKESSCKLSLSFDQLVNETIGGDLEYFEKEGREKSQNISRLPSFWGRDFAKSEI